MKSTLIFIFLIHTLTDVQFREIRQTMIVCHCRGVTDRQIRRLVREGACSAREVARSTGAGMRCGGCRSTVNEVVNQTVKHEIEPSHAAGPIVELEILASAEA